LCYGLKDTAQSKEVERILYIGVLIDSSVKAEQYFKFELRVQYFFVRQLVHLQLV
jgi:hypothetical protein